MGHGGGTVRRRPMRGRHSGLRAGDSPKKRAGVPGLGRARERSCGMTGQHGASANGGATSLQAFSRHHGRGRIAAVGQGSLRNNGGETWQYARRSPIKRIAGRHQAAMCHCTPSAHGPLSGPARPHPLQVHSRWCRDYRISARSSTTRPPRPAALDPLACARPAPQRARGTRPRGPDPTIDVGPRAPTDIHTVTASAIKQAAGPHIGAGGVSIVTRNAPPASSQPTSTKAPGLRTHLDRPAATLARDRSPRRHPRPPAEQRHPI
jgi:hypothetical protein